MASISVPATGEKIDDPAKVAAFLTPLGILHEEWQVEGRIGPDASPEEILTAYKPEIDRLKAGGGLRCGRCDQRHARDARLGGDDGKVRQRAYAR